MITLFSLGAFLANSRAAAPEASVLPGIHRIVFLGDSITYSGQYVEEFEACLITRFPDRRFEIINLGLPSETVSGLSEEGHAGGQFPRPDLHERLARVLEKTKPDLVVACYGMNDGIYLPLSEERFQKFREGIQWLHAQVTKSGARILHVTSPTFDEVKGGHVGYGKTLDQYSQWLLDRQAQGWDVVDVHGPMSRYLAKRRASDPDFFLAGDGVHAGAIGHLIIAKQILTHLGLKEVKTAENAGDLVAMHPKGNRILKLVEERQRMMKDAWLTETRHLRPGMKTGLPLAEARAKGEEFEKQIHQLALAPVESKPEAR